MSEHGSSTTHPSGPEIVWLARPAHICCSTSTIRWPGGRGDPDALNEAQATGKPILLSVGYAACHWCHVMAHESFEDEATAAVMNELFVNIKVDREERPDIDQIYMSALHHLGEQGGWPLTMFLTPEGRTGLGRHVFPENLALRPAGLRRCAARGFAAVPRGAGQDRPEPRFADGAACGRRPARRQGHGRRPRTRPVGPPDRRGVRPDQWRASRRAEIPQLRALRTGLAGRAARRRQAVFRADRAHAGAHLRGRHLRPPRRRLLALLGRRALAGAAFREDALRQRPASGAAGAGFCPERQPPVPPARDRDGRLAEARDDDAGRSIFSVARCRFGRRGGQVLRLVRGRDCRGSGSRKCCAFCAALRRERRGQF